MSEDAGGGGSAGVALTPTPTAHLGHLHVPVVGCAGPPTREETAAWDSLSIQLEGGVAPG